MTEEELKKLKKDICLSLSCDRHKLLTTFPFIGNLVLRMDLIPVRDFRCRTACTDGTKIYFDMDFYLSLKDHERVFILAHEVSHCMLLHLSRRQTRDPDLFNIATDMEVNYMLHSQPASCRIEPPSQVLFPPKKLEGKNAECIYDWLLKNMKKNANKNGKQQNSGQSGSSGSSGGSSNGKSSSKSQQYDESESYDDQEDSYDQRDTNMSKTPGHKTGKLEGQFDQHKYSGSDDESSENDQDNGNSDSSGQSSDDGDGNQSGNSSEKSGKGGKFGVKDRWGDVGIDPDFKPKVSKDFAEKMREAVITEVQRAERTQGTVPSGIDGLLNEIKKPEIKWQEVLAQFVTMCFNGKRRWLPPSRRHVYNEVYLQSRRSERVNVTVAIDTSGSCVGDLPKFFGELISLMNTFGGYDIHLIQCDAAVDKYDHYDDMGNPFPMDADKQIEWSGGGGTSFKPPFKFVREHNIQTDCFIYLTDSFGDAPEYPPPYPVLWILTADGNEDFCSWGKKIKFKNRSFSN